MRSPGRQQTKKRRSTVPICPTLKPWLELHDGRAIQWLAPRVEVETGALQYTLLPCDSIKTAFNKTLIDAGICHQVRDADGAELWLPPRRSLGETDQRPKLVGIGSPNTLRHTISTELHRRGVPEAQIETAAGHTGNSTNKRHYRHLRPEYLTEFVAGVESLWADVGNFTKVHLRYQCDTKIYDMAIRAKSV